MWSKGRAILALVVVLLPSVTRAQPQVTATGAIIIDANTGAVIWEQDADLPLPPASTTKVLTAIVALQSGRLDQRLLVTGNASAVEPTKIGLRPGQEVDLHDLLYAVLLRSANDAAVVVAEGLGGSIEAFAQRMNEKARSLGATRSNFVNPHGLTEPGHYTTARDLATIFRYGLRVPLFRDILSTPTRGGRDRRSGRPRGDGALAQSAAQRARVPGDRQDGLHESRAALLRGRGWRRLPRGRDRTARLHGSLGRRSAHAVLRSRRGSAASGAGGIGSRVSRRRRARAAYDDPVASSGGGTASAAAEGRVRSAASSARATRGIRSSASAPAFPAPRRAGRRRTRRADHDGSAAACRGAAADRRRPSSRQR